MLFYGDTVAEAFKKALAKENSNEEFNEQERRECERLLARLLDLNREISTHKREFDRLNSQVIRLVGQRVLERAQAAAGVGGYAIAAIALPEAALAFALARTAMQRVGMSFLTGIVGLNIASDIDSILDHLDASREITARLRPILFQRQIAFSRMRRKAREYFPVLRQYQTRSCDKYQITFWERRR